MERRKNEFGSEGELKSRPSADLDSIFATWLIEGEECCEFKFAIVTFAGGAIRSASRAGRIGLINSGVTGISSTVKEIRFIITHTHIRVSVPFVGMRISNIWLDESSQ